MKISGKDRGDTYEETIRTINALNSSEGKKIRYKIILAKKDLHDPTSLQNIPLELFPKLLEMVQQELGYNSFGGDFLHCSKMRTRHSKANPDLSLKRLYETIMAWPSLPLLFNRGAGDLKKLKKASESKKKKARKRRRKFGDEDDDDDESLDDLLGGDDLTDDLFG